MKFATGITASNRFALITTRKETSVTSMVRQGWVPIAEDETSVLLWWPCACDPPGNHRTNSPAPPERGELD